MKYKLTAGIYLLTACGLLGFGGCDSQPKQSPETEKYPQFKPLEKRVPEQPVIEAAMRNKATISPVTVPVTPPKGALERVRLLAVGKLYDRPIRFDAEVVTIEDSVLGLSGDYRLGYRLPQGHVVPFRQGDQVFIEYLPTTTRGSDDVSVTVYELAPNGPQPTNDKSPHLKPGAVLLQIIQRGGLQPVRISERGFTVVQTDTAHLIQQTELDLTSRVEVRLTAEGKQTILHEDKPFVFSVNGSNYRITLLKSLHTEHLNVTYSDEGPPFYLEYVLSRVASPE